MYFLSFPEDLGFKHQGRHCAESRPRAPGRSPPAAPQVTVKRVWLINGQAGMLSECYDVIIEKKTFHARSKSDR